MRRMSMKTRAKHSAYTISFNSRNDLIVEILFLLFLFGN